MIDETQIAEIGGGNLPIERIRDIRQAIDLAKQQVKAMEEMWDTAVLDHIDATGRDLVLGDVRYYAGVKKTTKCRNVKDTLALFLAVTDLDTLADCLSSNAFKPGAAKLAITPDQWDKCFIVEEQAELKEGKPTKTLQKANTNFVKGNKHGNDTTTNDSQATIADFGDWPEGAS